ncbi:hypothetical protein STEG23_005283, partial [Scotinomys teguina]
DNIRRGQNAENSSKTKSLSELCPDFKFCQKLFQLESVKNTGSESGLKNILDQKPFQMQKSVGEMHLPYQYEDPSPIPAPM